MKSGEFEDAVSSYTKSINLYSGEPAAYSNRALANLKLKKFSQCIEDSDACLKLDPKFIKAFHRRGKAYQACNKWELAIKDYQTILELEPENVDINKSLRVCRQKLNKIEDAEWEKKPKVEEVVDEVDTTPATTSASKEDAKKEPVTKNKFTRV